MRDELEQLFGQLAQTIPASLDDTFLFSAQIFPDFPNTIEAPMLVVQKGLHYYGGSFRADQLHFQAFKNTYRQLGLLILACLFQPELPDTQLKLTHPASEIKSLAIVNLQKNRPYPGEYRTLPYQFSYLPQEAQKHPWYDRYDVLCNPSHLPCFLLTNNQDASVTEEEWRQRDIVQGFGSDRGSVLLAELLLNISRNENTVDEYELEGEAGFRGVGPGSAEVRLWLPGSLGWNSRFFA